MDRVNLKSETNLLFNNNWSSYCTSRFGATFLSKSNFYESRNLIVFDAAEIVDSIDSRQTNISALFGLENAEFSIFSFSQGSQASLKNSKILTRGNELSILIEIKNDRKASVFFKFGKDVAKLIDSLAESTDQKAESIESKNFELSIDRIKRSLKRKTSIQDVLAFSLETMGFEISTVPIADFEKAIDEALSKIPKVDGVLFEAGHIRDGTPDAWAHGDIEDRALKGIFSGSERLKIYYGNWLRDYSSVLTGAAIGFDLKDREGLNRLSPKPIAVDTYEQGFFSRPSQDTWIKIIELLAANEFVYKRTSRPTHNILAHVETLKKVYDTPTKNVVGLYRPEEHIDNPKALIDETPLSDSSLDAPVKYTYSKMDSLKNPIKYVTKKLYPGESSESLKITSSKLKKYIKNTVDHQRPSSLRYVGEQLRLAKKKGRNKTGFRHFGAALHVIEDFYAHSNFVEVALIKLGHTNVYPWVDSYVDGSSIPKNNIDACKIPIVTGYFGQLDVIASLSPKIAKEFFPTSYQDYKTLKPGDRTLMDEFIIIMLDDYIGKEEGMKPADKYSFLGYGYEDMKANYLYYLEILDLIREAEQVPVLGSVVTGYKKLMNGISQTITFLPNLLISSLLNSLDEAVHSRQTQAGPIGTDPSHTQLAKDHADHHFNDLAGFMAYLVVGRIGEEMEKCWKGEISIESIIDLVDKRYFVHPCDVTWIDSHIKKWAKDNSSKVKRGESKTLYEHGTKEYERYKKQFDDTIKEYV